MQLQELYLNQNWAAKDPNRESAQMGNLHSLAQEIIQRDTYEDFLTMIFIHLIG